MLVGRDSELAVIDGLFAALPEGASLVLHGQAGVGKSALLREAAARAVTAGMTVVSAVGLQSEADVPFTGLLQLLGPLLRDDQLPAPARETIRGLAVGPVGRPVPPVAVAMAALDLLTARAARSPVLIVVDDAQWVDGSTWDALVFVSRRVAFDRVLLLAALRDGAAATARLEQARLPGLPVEPLGERDAAALLAVRFPGLPGRVARQVLAQAAGNPLGLLELAAAAGRAGDAGLGTLPLPDRLTGVFTRALADLPRSARALLLAAALDDDGELSRVIAAAARASGVPVTPADLEPAVVARLAEVDEGNRVRFRHPLIRSAIGQAASAQDRSRVHLALAGLLPAGDDRGTWHRAAAAAGADAALAAELAGLGMRACDSGALAVAVRALERSAQLSPDVAERSSRLYWAAETASRLGDHDLAVRLSQQVDPAVLPVNERLQLDWLRETYLTLSWTGARRLPGFAAVIDRIRAAGDDELALDALEQVCLRVWWSEAGPGTRDQFLAVAGRLRVPPDDPRLIFALAHVAPVERGAQVLRLLQAPRALGETDPARQHLLGMSALAVGAWEDARPFLAGAVAGLRDQGQLGALGEALCTQVSMAVLTGDARLAAVAATEARTLLAEGDRRLWVQVADNGRAWAAALRGDAETALELTRRTEAELTQLGAQVMLAVVQLVRGVAALAAGRYAESYSQLRRLFDPADPVHHPFIQFWAVGFLAEAAAVSRPEEARELLAALAPAAERGRSPALRAGLAHAACLLAPPGQAGELFRATLDDPALTLPWDRGRVHLAYGAWLRRQRQLVAARDQLRTAQGLLDGLGVTPWADRARRELRATGETIRRPGDAADALTPQELQIALLAADGLSNRAIAEKLYLSPRTVTTHLYRAFPKLGVTGRAELRRVLPPNT